MYDFINVHFDILWTLTEVILGYPSSLCRHTVPTLFSPELNFLRRRLGTYTPLPLVKNDKSLEMSCKI